MSRQSENKENQGWKKKCPCCGNCTNFSSEKEIMRSKYIPQNEYTVEKSLRCELGGFKTGKSNWCNKHEYKQQ